MPNSGSLSALAPDLGEIELQLSGQVNTSGKGVKHSQFFEIACLTSLSALKSRQK